MLYKAFGVIVKLSMAGQLFNAVSHFGGAKLRLQSALLLAVIYTQFTFL